MSTNAIVYHSCCWTRAYIVTRYKNIWNQFQWKILQNLESLQYLVVQIVRVLSQLHKKKKKRGLYTYILSVLVGRGYNKKSENQDFDITSHISRLIIGCKGSNQVLRSVMSESMRSTQRLQMEINIQYLPIRADRCHLTF